MESAYANFNLLPVNVTTNAGGIVAQSSASSYLKSQFLPALYQCATTPSTSTTTATISPAACQRLANLCALVYGDPRHPICAAYSANSAPTVPTLCVAIYVYVFYTFQATRRFMWLPGSADEGAFFGALVAAAVVQTFHVAVTTLRQCQTRVYVVDWEKPRISADGMNAGALAVPGTVSAWRSVHVARKLVEVATYRRIHLGLTALAVAVLVPADPNWFVAVAQQSLAFLGLAAAQFLVVTLAIERFASNPPMDFVDLLTVANLSLILLDGDDPRGFYLHGRSVFPEADTDMASLVGNLRREASDVVGRRGLTAGGDVVFEVIASPSLHRGGGATKWITAPFTDRLGVVSTAPVSSRRHKTLNVFFTRFLDQNLKEQRYRVIQRTWSDRWLGSYPQTESNVSLFCRETMWAGMELRVMLLVLLTFNLATMAAAPSSSSSSAATTAGSRIVPAVAAYLVQAVLRWARGHFGRRALSHFTGLDQRLVE
ncbi:hypothetical protein H9P43_009488 [Blastocladiella emersonii ATCC 22665]|nr:hypothetical protein H9P43_009488 [Blastocladiella emersonii ATCC 22665]